MTSARQALLSATFLAHQSWVMVDAILRTLWRLLISQRRRLEWMSADMVARQDFSAAQVARRMWAAPVLATGAAILVTFVSPGRLPLALPLIVLWAGSPWIAYVTGRPLLHARPSIDAARAGGVPQNRPPDLALLRRPRRTRAITG